MRQNLELVKRLHASTPYSQALLDSGALAPDVEWWAAGPTALPWAGTWRGTDAVRAFFERLNRTMDYDRFEGEEFLASGDTVVAIVAAGGRAIATGKRFESHVVRIYTFRDGRIARVRNFYDTAAYLEALRP